MIEREISFSKNREQDPSCVYIKKIFVSTCRVNETKLLMCNIYPQFYTVYRVFIHVDNFQLIFLFVFNTRYFCSLFLNLFHKGEKTWVSSTTMGRYQGVQCNNHVRSGSLLFLVYVRRVKYRRLKRGTFLSPHPRFVLLSSFQQTHKSLLFLQSLLNSQSLKYP